MPTDSIFKSLYWRLNKGETETDTDTDTETRILGYSNFPNQTLGAYVCARCSSQPTPTVQNVYSAQYYFCFYFFWGHLRAEMAMIVAFWERIREVIHFQSSSSVFLFFFCFSFDNINSASSPFSTGGWNTIGCKLKKKRPQIRENKTKQTRKARTKIIQAPIQLSSILSIL